MIRFLVKRLVKAVLTIWFILTLVFVFTRLSGDPTDWVLPDDATEETRMELRESLGLNEPIMKQYTNTLTSILSGDAGRSYNYLLPGQRAVRRTDRRHVAPWTAFFYCCRWCLALHWASLPLLIAIRFTTV